MAESKIGLALQVLDMHIALLRAKDPFSDALVYEIREGLGLYFNRVPCSALGRLHAQPYIIGIRLQPCATKKSAMSLTLSRI